MEFFSHGEMLRRANLLHSGYINAAPFAHCAIDGLFPISTLKSVLDGWPPENDPYWELKRNQTSFKLSSRSHLKEFMVAPAVRAFMQYCYSATMLEFLENLTGIKGLVGDPYHEGGGPYSVPSGGYLKIHADFNKHPRLLLYRRVNLLIYLNPNWQDEWGGFLELWNEDRSECGRRIAPIMGRSVIFNTTRLAFHGHPRPLLTPAHISRNAIGFYYYAAEPADLDDVEERTTLYFANINDLKADAEISKNLQQSTKISEPLNPDE